MQASDIHAVANLRGRTVGAGDVAAPGKDFFGTFAAKQRLPGPRPRRGTVRAVLP